MTSAGGNSLSYSVKQMPLYSYVKLGNSCGYAIPIHLPQTTNCIVTINDGLKATPNSLDCIYPQLSPSNLDTLVVQLPGYPFQSRVLGKQ